MIHSKGASGDRGLAEGAMKKKISIYRDDVWAGTGTIADGQIECSAVLGVDQDASDECYAEIADAIEGGQMSGSIMRPDGEYSWRVEGETAALGEEG